MDPKVTLERLLSQSSQREASLAPEPPSPSPLEVSPVGLVPALTLDDSDEDDTPNFAVSAMQATYSYATFPFSWLYNQSENLNYLFTGSSNSWQSDKTRTILEQMTQYLEKIYLPKSLLSSRPARLLRLQRVLRAQIRNSPKDLQSSLNIAINLLTSPSQYSNPETRRTGLFEALDRAQQCKHYKKILRKMENMRKEEQLRNYPDICLLHNIYEALVLQVNLLDYGTTMIFDMYDIGKDHAIEHGVEPIEVTLLEEDDIPSKIDKMSTALSYVSPEYCASRVGIIWGKLEGWLNWNFCPQRGNNFFSTLLKETFTNQKGEKQNVQLLRFGTPTKEYSTWLIGALFRSIISGPYAEVISEFKCFLDIFKREGKSYAIFNHQNIEASATGNEAHRSHALERLAEEYPEIFFVIHFPMHGNFFHQRGEYDLPESCQTSNRFLASFLIQITKRYNFPMKSLIARGYRKETIEQELMDILSGIRDIIFQEKQKLTASERTSFQLIAYAYIRKYLCVRLELSAYSSNCKDSIDRTAILNALDYWLYLKSKGLENEPKELNTFFGILYFGAWLVKEQPVIESRSRLLKDAITVLENMPEESIKRLSEFFTIFGVTHEMTVDMPTQLELITAKEGEIDEKEIYERRLSQALPHRVSSADEMYFPVSPKSALGSETKSAE
ncbi:hypothetical protein SCG7109_AQ_00080 [Chlamydiales bacterium SCGC AG-110-M15]|nr:hypothetical protein SCG7109_AQ_00080 [Chlamydiales bacterium SCGC AG-110-M15]